MVCPICIATAIVANAPAIAAVAGGAAAAKAAKSAYDKAHPAPPRLQEGEVAAKFDFTKPKPQKLEIRQPKQ